LSFDETSTDERPLSAILGTQTAVVAIGNAFTLIVGLPLQVYVSRVLGAANLGVYGLLEASFVTVAGLLSLGVGQTIVRFVPEHLARGQFEAVRRLLRLGLMILLLVGLAAVALCAICLDWIVARWPTLANERPAILLMSLIVPLTLLLTMSQQALRGFHDVRYMVAGSSFLQLTIKAAVTLVAFGLGYRLQGYIGATIGGLSCGCLWMLVGIRRATAKLPRGGLTAGNQKAWTRYAAINYGNSLISTATANLDRFLLGALFGPSLVGVLLVTRQLQSFPVVFNQMLLMVGAPMFAAAHGRNDTAERQHLFVLMTDWVVRLSLPLIVFLILFADPLLSLYGRRFAEDGRVALQIMTVGQLVNVLSGPNGNLALMSGLERQAIRLFVVMGFVSSAMLIAFTPPLGLAGAAIAAATTNVVTNVACLTLIRRRLGVRWWDRRYLKWLLPTAATSIVGLTLLLAFGIDDAWELGGTLIGLYLVFAGANLAQGLHADDRDFLRHVLAQIKMRRSAA
jgi:O-antigen/teichoic acid export membrane protein